MTRVEEQAVKWLIIKSDTTVLRNIGNSSIKSS